MTMVQSESGLYVPPAMRQTFKKAPPPKTGDAFGAWAGRDVQYLQLPGGATLQFDLSRLTLGDFRAMRDHYQINISLAVLTFMMHQVDWHIECEDKKIADFIEDDLRRNWTALMRSVSTSYWAGFAPTVIDWDNADDGIRIKRFKDLLPEEAVVNWRKVLGYAPPGKPQPTFWEYDGIKQRSAPYPIPVENTFWYPLLMEGGDYYGRKLLKPAFPSWFFSILIHLFANRYFERFGEPVPIGRYPSDTEVTGADGTMVSSRSAMEEILVNLRNRAVVSLPSDREASGGMNNTGKAEYTWDIDYLESQMRGADFERYLFRLDEEMSLALFTPTLLVRTADVGSYNLGVGHLQMYLWMLNALGADLKSYIDWHIVERMKAYNFSPKAKRAEWVPRQQGRQQAEVLRAVVAGIISGGTAKPDLIELGDAIGLTLEEVEQLTEPEPELDADGNPIDPPAPDPKKDKRTARQRPKKPAGAGGSRGSSLKSVAAKVKARVAGQFQKAIRERALSEFEPDTGHRRQLEEAGGAEWAEHFEEVVDAHLSLMAEAVRNGLDVEVALESFNSLVDRLVGED